jgi:SAM-dependent methyltransferase
MSFKKSARWLELRGRLHTHLIGLLAEHLNGCRSVLDLGCGTAPYVGECAGVEVVVGVDACYESCRSAQTASKYARVVQSVLPQLPFRERSVDCVTMLQVVEHLPKATASRLIEEAEKLARHKIIITTPNGFVEQDGHSANPFQRHLSGWTIDDFERRGYNVWGLEGLKITRRKRKAEMLPPQRILSVLTSFGIFENYIKTRPHSAFQLMAVKELTGK